MFPACAGVILVFETMRYYGQNVPRMCGGDSGTTYTNFKKI